MAAMNIAIYYKYMTVEEEELNKNMLHASGVFEMIDSLSALCSILQLIIIPSQWYPIWYVGSGPLSTKSTKKSCSSR
jgi:hypothetical protein